MSEIKFNVNHGVKVKLTNRGKKLLEEDYLKLMGENWSKIHPYESPHEDGEGWSTWQLWVLMSDLGEHMGWGFDPLFETEIKFIVEEKENSVLDADNWFANLSNIEKDYVHRMFLERLAELKGEK